MTYDCVNWVFHHRVLQRLGFGDTWFRWTMICVSSITYSILRVGPIVLWRGISQGAPLSAYSFILVAEGISSHIHKVIGCGDLHGVQVCLGAPLVSHMLFSRWMIFVLQGKGCWITKAIDYSNNLCKGLWTRNQPCQIWSIFLAATCAWRLKLTCLVSLVFVTWWELESN